jgi:hypothetical protein
MEDYYYIIKDYFKNIDTITKEEISYMHDNLLSKLFKRRV